MANSELESFLKFLLYRFCIDARLMLIERRILTELIVRYGAWNETNPDDSTSREALCDLWEKSQGGASVKVVARFAFDFYLPTTTLLRLHANEVFFSGFSIRNISSPSPARSSFDI